VSVALEVLWSSAEAVRQRLSSCTAEAAGPVAAQFGLNGPGWRLLHRVRVVAPEAVTASRLGGLNPYVNPWTYEAGLQHLASLGFLAAHADGAYVLTTAGEAALGAILAASESPLVGLVPPERVGVARLEVVLEIVVANSLAAPEPARKPRLALSRGQAQGRSATAMLRLDQALGDMIAFRDDCHFAAWQHHMVSGPAWDAFQTLWRGTPGTLEAVYAQLARRGWPVDAYARALQELVRRDWVRGPEPYTLTPLGQTVRERADAQTHRDFYGPWRAVEPAALAELRADLDALQAALQPMPEAP
jgi:hypothetical protein